jgi:hypothetical protein
MDVTVTEVTTRSDELCCCRVFRVGVDGELTIACRDAGYPTVEGDVDFTWKNVLESDREAALLKIKELDGQKEAP